MTRLEGKNSPDRRFSSDRGSQTGKVYLIVQEGESSKTFDVGSRWIEIRHHAVEKLPLHLVAWTLVLNVAIELFDHVLGLFQPRPQPSHNRIVRVILFETRLKLLGRQMQKAENRAIVPRFVPKPVTA